MYRVLVLVLFFFASCKSDNKQTDALNSQLENSINNYDLLNIELTAKYLLNDNILLFYTEDFETYKYNIENSIQKSIFGKEEYQMINFEIPGDVNLEGIKLLLSTNNRQNSILLKQIRIYKEGKEYLIDSHKFINLFNFSKFIHTTNGREIEFLEVEGIYDPNILSSSQLNNEIIKF